MAITYPTISPASTDSCFKYPFAKGDGTQNQVLGGTEVVCISAAKGPGAHCEKGKSDSCNHRGSHHWGNDSAPVFGQKSQGSFKDTAYEHGSHHSGITVVGCNGAEDGDESKADAHDNGKLRANPPYGIQLNHSGDACHKHCVLEQNGCLGLAQGRLCRSCYDGNRRKVGDEHGQDVLEAEGDGFGDWHPSLQFVYVVDTAIGIAVHDWFPL